MVASIQEGIKNLISAIKDNNVKYPDPKTSMMDDYKKALEAYNMKKELMSEKERLRQEIFDKIEATAVQKTMTEKLDKYLQEQAQKTMASTVVAPSAYVDEWVEDVMGDIVDWDTGPYVTQQAFDQINLELARKGKKIMQKNVRPQDEETRITALGAVGEKLVRWYLSSVLGFKIIEAFDSFDKEKDFEFENGETAEIKTQSPYYNLHAFAVKSKQLLKLTNVDHIYFVETPRRKDIPSQQWKHAKRNEFVNGPIEDKKASEYECKVYVLHKVDKNINEFVTRKKVFDKNGVSREMLLIPIDELEEAFTIAQEKHVILLDRYSTNPIGLIDG